MMVNGLSPGLTGQEVSITAVEKERLTENIQQQEQILRKEAKQAEEKKETGEKKGDNTKLVMNDYQLKELLFMMTSRGNSSTVEKLAQLLKKEKEMLNRGR